MSFIACAIVLVVSGIEVSPSPYETTVPSFTTFAGYVCLAICFPFESNAV